MNGTLTNETKKDELSFYRSLAKTIAKAVGDDPASPLHCMLAALAGEGMAEILSRFGTDWANLFSWALLRRKGNARAGSFPKIGSETEKIFILAEKNEERACKALALLCCGNEEARSFLTGNKINPDAFCEAIRSLD